MRARSHQSYQEQVYRAYVTEAVKNLSENVANGFGKEGATYMSKSYIEILYPPKEDDRSADDIIDGIKRKIEEYE